MLQKFKLFFDTLSPAEKSEAIKYIQSLSANEGFYTGPSQDIHKGLYTGPMSSSGKCPKCGK